MNLLLLFIYVLCRLTFTTTALFLANKPLSQSFFRKTERCQRARKIGKLNFNDTITRQFGITSPLREAQAKIVVRK